MQYRQNNNTAPMNLCVKAQHMRAGRFYGGCVISKEREQAESTVWSIVSSHRAA